VGESHGFAGAEATDAGNDWGRGEACFIKRLPGEADEFDSLF